MADAPASRPKVSVIIPSFGRPDRLGSAIESVRRQTFQDWELIVVDDNDPASDDRVRTRQVVEDAAASPRVHYLLHSANRGGGAARNTGARAASGDYLAFLDDDDLWYPHKLELQVAALEAAGANVGLVYCGFRRIEVNGASSLQRPEPSAHALENLLVDNGIGTTSVAVCPRRVFEQVGGFDESLGAGQDIDLYVRIAAAYDVTYVDEVLVDYFKHGGAAIGRNPGAGIRAFHAFEEKYATLLDRYPATRPRRRQQLAELYRVAGRLDEARRLYLELWRSAPLRASYAVGLLSSNRLGQGIRNRIGAALGRRAPAKPAVREAVRS